MHGNGSIVAGMAESMKANMHTIRKMVLAFIFGLMAAATRENGKTGSAMVEASIS